VKKDSTKCVTRRKIYFRYDGATQLMFVCNCEMLRIKTYAGIAQLVEQRFCKP
jgi:hypothetical protein